MKIYLAGPINGRTDAECMDWRERVKLVLPDTLDPMARDYRGREAGSFREIVEGDKRDIEASDAVLVYFDGPSVGTSMEVFYAHSLGKPVIVANVSGSQPSPWLVYHASFVTESLDEAIAVVGALRK